jgi:hypothetical protein
VTQRARGPIEKWRPQPRTRALIADIREILDANRDYWPLSIRAVYYRLLGTGRYAKDPKLAKKISEHVGNARRAGIIPWDAIHDSSMERIESPSWRDDRDWLDAARRAADAFRTDRQEGQPQRLLVWCEAKGMAAMLASVADEFGITVLSGSGFDSVTVRHEVGVSTWEEIVPLVVLHVGDLDPHGEAIYRACAEDVIAWADAGGGEAEFVRLAVTREQVKTLDLPDDPDHPGAVQAEAIPPATMSEILRDAITSRLDEAALSVTLTKENAFRSRLVGKLVRS